MQSFQSLAIILALAGWIFAPAAMAGDIEVDAVVVNLINEVKVPAQEAGALAEVVSREGMRVKAGDILVRIDDRDAALEVSRAEIALDHAKEQADNDVKLRMAKQRLRVAELDLKNAEAANKELAKVISDSQIQKLRIEVENSELEIEQATRDLAAARRTVAAATNDLRVAERAIQRRRIEAPSDGVVVEVRRHVGEWVQPGEAVIRIVKDDRLRAEGFVHLDQLGASPLGQPAELVALLPGEGATRFQGTVTFVSPEANPINGQVRVWAEFDNRDGRLRAGLSARLIVKPAPATKP